tara:strand:+ start:553 stop:756 length:204 start_codon:yes stop_codon:yes gene_type:complete
MTRKDYIKIAEVLRKNKMPCFSIEQTWDSQTQHHNDLIKLITNDLCKIFLEDNSRFDMDRFRKAVNV